MRHISKGLISCLQLTVCRRFYIVYDQSVDVKFCDAYDTLGLKDAHSASPQQIRDAFIQKAKELRANERQLRDLISAFVLLSNPRSKTVYDEYKCGKTEQNLGLAGECNANFDVQHQQFMFSDQSCTQKLWEGNAQMSSCKEERNVPSRGKDVRLQLNLTFGEVAEGCTKEIRYHRLGRCKRCRGAGVSNSRVEPCPQCFGRGWNELPSGTYLVRRSCLHCEGKGVKPLPKCKVCTGSRTHQAEAEEMVKVDSSSWETSCLRVRGGGDCGTHGGPTGDLVVDLVIQEHPFFCRDGYDLHVCVPITLSTALLGGYISVPTLEGSQQIYVANINEVIELKKKGLKKKECEIGSLYVHVAPLIPNGSCLSGRQRHCIEDFSCDCNESQDSFADLKKKFSHWFAAV